MASPIAKDGFKPGQDAGGLIYQNLRKLINIVVRITYKILINIG